MSALRGLLALMALLVACGGIADEQSISPMPAESLEHDQVDCRDPINAEWCEGIDTTFYGTLPYGEVPAGVPVDKNLSVDLNGSRVHIPDWYGMYYGGNKNRCNPTQSGWDQDCVVEQNRSEVVYLDNASCEPINATLSYRISDAINDWMLWAVYWAGWDITWTGVASQATLQVHCDNKTAQDENAFTAGSISFCWEIPGKNVCFRQEEQAVWIHLQQLENFYGQTVDAQNVVYNITYHELLHALAFGHDTFANSLMNASEVYSDGFLGHMSPTTIQTDAARNFNRDWYPCKWQSGDALGLACPHEGPY